MINLANEIQLAQDEKVSELDSLQKRLLSLETVAQSILDELKEATAALESGINFSMVSHRTEPVQSNTTEKINLPHAFFRMFLKDVGSYDICLLADGSYWIASGYGCLNHTQLPASTIEAVVDQLKGPILKQAQLIAERKFKHSM